MDLGCRRRRHGIRATCDTFDALLVTAPRGVTRQEHVDLTMHVRVCAAGAGCLEEGRSARVARDRGAGSRQV